MLKPLTALLALPVAYYSYRGGAWLWRGMAAELRGKEKWIRPGAAVLTAATGGAAWWLSRAAGGDPGTLSRAATLVVALGLSYNFGYLVSIAPGRADSRPGKKLATPMTALLAVGPVLVALAGPRALPEIGAPLWAAAGSGLALTGFAVWEGLRRQPALQAGAFRETLWKLSVGFVGLCTLITGMGIAASKIPALEQVTLAAAWLVLVCLFFYLVGLFAALPRGE